MDERRRVRKRVTQLHTGHAAADVKPMERILTAISGSLRRLRVCSLQPR
jgi:hypothetical protein